MNRKVFVKILLSILAITILLPVYAFADPVLINLSPNRGRIGSSVTATVRYLDLQEQEQNRVFINGILAPVRRIYGVSGSEDLGKVLFFIPPNVISEPNTSPITLQVTVEVDGVQSNSLDYTLYPSPMITDVDPANGLQGEHKDITIKVANVRLRSRGLRVDFGDGIQVSNVDVTSPNTIRASISIADDAEPGLRDVTIRMGRGRLKKIGGFTVSAPATAAGLRLDVNRVPSPVFSRSVVISGAVNRGAGSGSNATTPEVPPIITAILPSSGAQGQELVLEIKGQNTHFAANATQLSFGPGIEVLEANVTSPTSIIARIKIESSASTGGRHVIAVSGAEEATSVLAFNVVAGSLTITGKVVDENGNPIPGAEVSIKGYNLKTKTDPSGTFTIINVPAGDQTLVINARNFASTEYKISGENGQTLDFASVPIRLERKAAPPSSTNTPTLLSVLSQGANRLIAPTSIEETKQLIINTIVAVGGNIFGVIDENGTQLNPKITGEGELSLKPKGVEKIARDWMLWGKSYDLVDAFLLFNTFAKWNPKPPDFEKWLNALNNGLQNIWENPSEHAAYPLLAFIFNKNSTISDNPPKLSLTTKLNPLQMFLFVNSFFGYVSYKINHANLLPKVHSTMVAKINPSQQRIIEDIDPGNAWIFLADNSNPSSGDTGSQNFYNDLGNNIIGTTEATVEDTITQDIIGTNWPSETDFAIDRLGNFLIGVLDGMAGSIFQQIYSPFLNTNWALKGILPLPPKIKKVKIIKQGIGGNSVIIWFEKCEKDRRKNSYPIYYYTIYRKDKHGNIEKFVKKSSDFQMNSEGYLVFEDDSPPVGAVSYFFQSHVRRIKSVPPVVKGWLETSTVFDLILSLEPAGSFLFNTLMDVANSLYEIYMGAIFQSSNIIGPVTLMITQTENHLPSLELAVDHKHEREYLNAVGKIYAHGNNKYYNINGWEPIFSAWTNTKGYQKGLCIDSNGTLYVEASASEALFGGRIWGFRNAYTLPSANKNNIPKSPNRFFLGSVNYYSYVIYMSKPVDISDMFIGHFKNFATGSFNNIIRSFDPESIAILDVASQKIKLLDRNKGKETPMGISGSHHVSVPLKEFTDGQITPFSKIAQNPLEFDDYYFVTSKNNILFVSKRAPSKVFHLFSPMNIRFIQLSDLIFDYSGNLYFLDKNLGKLFLVPGPVVEKRIKHLSDNETINLNNVFTLLDGLTDPQSIEFGIDYKTIIIADSNGIHRIVRLIPFCLSPKTAIIMERSTILQKLSDDGTKIVPQRGNYVFLPAEGKDADILNNRLIIRQKDDNASDLTIPIYFDECLDIENVTFTHFDLSDNLTLQDSNSTFKFTMNIPDNSRGKLLFKTILVPVPRLVKKINVNSPMEPPQIKDELESPISNISKLITFSPYKVMSGNIAKIAMITAEDTSFINVHSDSEQNIEIDRNGKESSFQLQIHDQKNIVQIEIQKDAEISKKVIEIYGSDKINTTTLTGFLLDSNSKQPLAHARIYIKELDKEVYTDKNGKYSIEVPVGQDITLEVDQSK